MLQISSGINQSCSNCPRVQIIPEFCNIELFFFHKRSHLQPKLRQNESDRKASWDMAGGQRLAEKLTKFAWCSIRVYKPSNLTQIPMYLFKYKFFIIKLVESGLPRTATISYLRPPSSPLVSSRIPRALANPSRTEDPRHIWRPTKIHFMSENPRWKFCEKNTFHHNRSQLFL